MHTHMPTYINVFLSTTDASTVSMEETNHVMRGHKHAFFDMEEGVLQKIYAHVNPRPMGTPAVADADAVVPSRPRYPILTREQTYLNYVLARRIPEMQLDKTFARLSRVMRDEDVKSGSALFFAIKNLSDDSVCDLIEMNPEALILFNYKNNTPLCDAIIKQRSFAVIQHMVRKNSAILTQVCNNVTPLVYAIRRGYAANVISMLIDDGQTVVRMRDTYHMLPLGEALNKGYAVDVLKLLVYADCPDVFEAPLPFTHDEHQSWNQRVPLHIAIASPYVSLETVTYLVDLNEGALFLRNDRGYTALHVAVGTGRVEHIPDDIVRFLVARGPGARSCRSNDGETPLMFAVRRHAGTFFFVNNVHKTAALLRVLVDDDEVMLTFTSQDGQTSLLKACSSGMIQLVFLQVLLGGQSEKILVMTDPETQKTPLHFLLEHCSFKPRNGIEQAQLLCTDKTVLTMCDYHGDTPLNKALQYKTTPALFELLCPESVRFAMLTTPNNMGDLPLHIAAKNTSTPDNIIVLLITNTAQTLDARNKNDDCALDIVLRQNGVGLARILLFLHQDTNLKAVSSDGNTPLHTALLHGADVAVIDHLLKLDPGVLAVKNKMLFLPVMEALNTVHGDSSARWPSTLIERLVKCTQAADADAIPSCRSVADHTGLYGSNCGISVLELALKRQHPLRIIECIVNADINALTKGSPVAYCCFATSHYEKTMHHMNVTRRTELILPLHHAIWYGAHRCVLEFLTQAHPTGNVLECTDASGNTALHMAILQLKCIEERERHFHSVVFQKRHKVLMQTIFYLVRAGETSLLIQDKQGNTPLHMAIQIQSNFDIFEHLVLMSTPPPATYVKGHRLQEIQYDNVFVMRNAVHRTPLHEAALRNQLWMPRVAQAYPQALLIRDKRGRTPIHTVASQDFQEIWPSILYSLLEMNPAVLLVQDALNRTPLHTFLESMAQQRVTVAEESWLPIIHNLTGDTGNLLSPVQSKQLIEMRNGSWEKPYDYYWNHIHRPQNGSSYHDNSAHVVGMFLRELCMLARRIH